MTAAFQFSISLLNCHHKTCRCLGGCTVPKSKSGIPQCLSACIEQTHQYFLSPTAESLVNALDQYLEAKL